MKKLIILMTLLFINVSYSQQIKFVDEEYGLITGGIDPSATMKENSPNLYGALELVSYWGYVNINTQFLPDLLGGYWDFGGTFGVNLTSGQFQKMRYYTGFRLGFIHRGFTLDETYTYPLSGFEGGISRKLSDRFVLGIRGTGDYRTDFKYSGAEPKMRYSGFINISYILK